MGNKYYKKIILSLLLTVPAIYLAGQPEKNKQISEIEKDIKTTEDSGIPDSLKIKILSEYINSLTENEDQKNQVPPDERLDSEIRDSLLNAETIERIDSIKKTAAGYPVAPFSDTLFLIYTKIGASKPSERATNITARIKKLYDDEFLDPDSITTARSDNTVDIVIGDMILMSISDLDALLAYKSGQALADEYRELIINAIIKEKEKNSLVKVLVRIGLVIIVIAGIMLLIWSFRKLHNKAKNYIVANKDKWLKDLSYKDYTFLSTDQELRLVYLALKFLNWFMVLLSLYLLLPLIFSIFPFSRSWANDLFNLIWSPFRGIVISVWKYLPNLITILVIFFLMKYFIRFVKYIFWEIRDEKLVIPGFHADWAMTTFSIVRFLLYAFMFILIFPYLPGSDSSIFKGVSVFLGLLISLGSSSAIANMIAGLVITYMRPFKIGDRIKIGEITGDVIEKTLLVTRLKTIKNEEITIPNSSILSGNTINFSSYSGSDGLIIHTTVTIGYDVPWKDMHQALTEAALRTDLILKDPEPFVLQTSLDDFYVAYQCNAYIRQAGMQARITSDLHRNILDVCNEKGIEILSPHYRSQRDGNKITIPPEYLKPDYEPPTFNLKTTVADERKNDPD